MLEIAGENDVSTSDIKILSRRDILETILSSDERILFITPYEEESDQSDYLWAQKRADITRKSIPLSGVCDEGLQLDDATQYWKYHRIKDAICEMQGEFDFVYVEDIELSIGDMSYQLEESLGKKVVTTQSILWEEMLGFCGIGEKHGGGYAKL